MVQLEPRASTLPNNKAETLLEVDKVIWSRVAWQNDLFLCFQILQGQKPLFYGVCPLSSELGHHLFCPHRSCQLQTTHVDGPTRRYDCKSAFVRRLLAVVMFSCPCMSVSLPENIHIGTLCTQVQIVAVAITIWPNKSVFVYFRPKVPSNSRDVRIDMLEDVAIPVAALFVCGLLLVITNVTHTGIYDSDGGCSGFSTPSQGL